MARGKSQAPPLTENDVDAEEIRASVEKQRDRLRFVLLAGTVGAAAYVATQWVLAPPTPPRPEPSVECVRAGGEWRPEGYDDKGRHIEASCGRVKAKE